MSERLTSARIVNLVRPGPISVGVRDIGYSYQSDSGHKQVLNDLSLALRRGEFTILTGPSGAGKTTLLTLIGALRALQSGGINVLGTELAGLDSAGQCAIRRQIGFIFQDHNLFTALTAFQTLWLTMELAGLKPSRAEAEHRAREILASLGMEDHLHALPKQLSTGQKQRVAIARALVNGPGLILADEPTASLDHAHSERVISLIRRHVRDHGATVLMVTHDARIFGAADRVVEMAEGAIVAS